jgi:lipopolysaccharide/colanic/teichoic acid biosynthesis glycosyltransferase
MGTAAQSFPYIDEPVEKSALSVEPLATTPAASAPPADIQVAVVRQPRSKRIVDVTLAGTAILLLSPLLLVLLLAVAADTRANPIFVQERTGRGGRPFRMYKFRTMAKDAERRLEALRHLNEVPWPMFKIRKDPRITRLGRFLRSASLDELPQLLNIIKGDMSIVGPRPPLPHEVAVYSSDHARRLSVLPGLTGLWQVSGRADCTFELAVALDLRYIDTQSLRTDIAIILRTFSAVVRGKGAY